MLCSADFMLRPLAPGDAAAVFDAVLESSATLAPWMPWAHPQYSQADAEVWVDQCQQGWKTRSSFEFGIFDGRSDLLVGVCGLNQFKHANQHCNLGYWVRRSCQRRGAATQAVRVLSNFAFNALQLDRVEIVVAVGNDASLGVARKAGAIDEGVVRNRLQLGERVLDAHVLALVPPTPG